MLCVLVSTLTTCMCAWIARLLLLPPRLRPPLTSAARLPSADPLVPAVVEWWRGKAVEATSLVPGFAGFLIKADSEAEMGPSVYNRSTVAGANMLVRFAVTRGSVLLCTGE